MSELSDAAGLLPDVNRDKQSAASKVPAGALPAERRCPRCGGDGIIFGDNWMALCQQCEGTGAAGNSVLNEPPSV